jgi:hypothetical protein
MAGAELEKVYDKSIRHSEERLSRINASVENKFCALI